MSSLENYEIRDEIGSGAYGAVYRAWQPAVGREVAVKVIRPEHASEPEFVERFEAEAQMVARLEHPHIVPIHDYWRDDSGAYLVMRLLGGGSLKDALSSGPLSTEAVIQLADDICGALAAAHAAGVIHRDIKPSNIIFDERGNAYLADFGIAKKLGAGLDLTQSGAILGTPNYISPEQIKGEPVAPASDQYSIGIVLFETLTGRLPYPGGSVATVFHNHLTQPIPSLATANPDLPADLDPVLQQATAKEPAERFPDILEVAEALRLADSDQLSAVSGQLPVVSDQLSVASELPPFLQESERPERERPVFVGRESELNRLAEALEEAVRGQGKLIFVKGEAGGGKSALLSAFAGQASEGDPDLLVAWGICNAFSGRGDPYHPFRQILGTLTGDLESRVSSGTLTAEQGRRIWSQLPGTTSALVETGPDLIDTLLPGGELVKRLSGLPAGSAELAEAKRAIEGIGEASAELGQVQLFEQIGKVLRRVAAGKTLLLLLDDLQWADSGSIDLLFHLSRELVGARILILGSYRPEDVALGRGDGRHPLAPVLEEIKRIQGDIWIDLDRDHGIDFVNSLLNSEPNHLDKRFRETLFKHTQAHPLFAVELLRDLQERGDLFQDSEGYWVAGGSLDWSALPARVEGVIEARIGRLEDELRDILTVAAVEGEDFTAQVVARVQEMQERQLLRTLSQELERRHRLVQESSAQRPGRRLLSRYRFAHASFQQYLYNDLGEGERRLLHGEIADILEELYAGRLDDIAVQLAWHYVAAGEGDKALPYLLQAGDGARTLYAFDEAIQHYERALAIYKDRGDYERASRILMKMGLTYHGAFDYEGSRLAYEESFRLRQQSALSTPEIHSTRAPHELRLVMVVGLTLDVGMHTDADSHEVMGQLFSGLIRLTPDMNVVPDVARSWEVLNDGQTYVFHLRNDVRWSDGEPVTAHDFAFGFRRVLDPKNASPAAPVLYDIRGAAALNRGDHESLDALGVKALDDWTLRFELEQPCSYFLYVLENDAAFPVPSHVIASHGDAWTEPDNFVSNGPFRLKRFQIGQLIELGRNPIYHGDIPGNLDAVHIHFSGEEIADQNDVLRRYEKDELDVLNLAHVSPVERRRALQRRATEYVAVPLMSTFTVNFNVGHPPFDDPRVRQAFALATDRKTLAAVNLEGFYAPATGGFIPLGMPGHVAGIALPYDLERARRLMAEAGYPAGEGFPKVDALSHRLFRHIEAVLDSWRSALGVEIRCENVEWKVITEKFGKEGDLPHLYAFNWGADYPDPDSFMRLGVKRGTTWSNESYDALVAQARKVMDQDERMHLYRQAEEILVREAPFVPIIYYQDHLLVKPWIRNYRPSAIVAAPWKEIVIDPH